MTQPPIQFYHLLSTRLEHALPKLMEKAQSADMRVVIWGNAAQVALLDKALWSYDPNSFLPHGTNKDKHPAEQLIYLTETLENPNNATLLVIVGGMSVDDYNGYDRVFDIFDGSDDEAVAASRKRWKFYDNAGYPLTYIRQNERGGWDKIMEK